MWHLSDCFVVYMNFLGPLDFLNAVSQFLLKIGGNRRILMVGQLLPSFCIMENTPLFEIPFFMYEITNFYVHRISLPFMIIISVMILR